MAQLLREQRMSYDVGIWTRGIDRDIFHPGRRDMAWRRSLGIADDDPVNGFIGRLVMEKGLDVFSDTIAHLAAKNVRRLEEHTSELQSLMRLSYAVLCLKKKKNIMRKRQH